MVICDVRETQKKKVSEWPAYSFVYTTTDHKIPSCIISVFIYSSLSINKGLS